MKTGCTKQVELDDIGDSGLDNAPEVAVSRPIGVQSGKGHEIEGTFTAARPLVTGIGVLKSPIKFQQRMTKFIRWNFHGSRF